MKYFNSLPTISVTTKGNKTQTYKNLMTRLSMIPSVLTNPINFYTYDIQEGDTPEIIAHKYYNDMYRYWIILFANEILDPQWSWPLNSQQFESYIKDKYGYNEITGHWTTNPYSTIHHYTKKITQYDSTTFNIFCSPFKSSTSSVF